MVKELLVGSTVILILLLNSSDVWAVEARATNERSVADNAPTPRKNSRAPESGAEKTDDSAEDAARQLVESHLPELKSVLEHLRSHDPRQYNLAIRDLAKSARRLDVSKNRDPELYDLEVELLQAQSSVKLLTAKLKVRDSEADRKQLRESVSRLQRAELSRSAYDVRMLKDRLERAQKSLEAAEQRLSSKQDNFQEQLEKSYLGFLRKAGRQPDDESSDRKK